MNKPSKSVIKEVRALEQRKYRREQGLFIAESDKLVLDNLGVMRCRSLFATPEWWQAHPRAAAQARECYEADTLDSISLLRHPQNVMGVFEIPFYPLKPEDLTAGLVLCLDTVQDPGNLGTIIRLCDWFGIRDIVCSRETADCYAPKVVQATMGAIARVRVHYTDLSAFLTRMRELGVPVYGTYLEGENIYTAGLSPNGVLIMGNEGNGISPGLSPLITQKLNIPSYPAGIPTSESLNVGIAAAVAVAEFRRRVNKVAFD